MKVYTVHIHPGRADPLADAVLIREGFNFWAFLLTGLWALYHRQWLAFFGLIVVSLICSAISWLGNGGEMMDFALALVTGIGFGLIANDVRRRKLSKSGWKLVDIIASADESGAEHRFFASTRHAPAFGGTGATNPELS
ncbi:MAG: DUF2628 domain-containing protein [Pseudomonadota bacterium]